MDDSFSSSEGSDLLITAAMLTTNDRDPEGNALTVQLISLATASGGRLEATGGGWRYVPPSSDFHGTDAFSYRVSDGSNLSKIATARITVNSVNDTPELDTRAETFDGAFADTVSGVTVQTSSGTPVVTHTSMNVSGSNGIGFGTWADAARSSGTLTSGGLALEVETDGAMQTGDSAGNWTWFGALAEEAAFSVTVVPGEGTAAPPAFSMMIRAGSAMGTTSLQGEYRFALLELDPEVTWGTLSFDGTGGGSLNESYASGGVTTSENFTYTVNGTGTVTLTLGDGAILQGQASGDGGLLTLALLSSAEPSLLVAGKAVSSSLLGAGTGRYFYAGIGVDQNWNSSLGQNELKYYADQGRVEVGNDGHGFWFDEQVASGPEWGSFDWSVNGSGWITLSEPDDDADDQNAGFLTADGHLMVLVSHDDDDWDLSLLVRETPSPLLHPIFEDIPDAYNTGTRVADLLGGGSLDPDGDTLGMAVTGSGSHGTWQFSQDNGLSWSDMGAVSDSSARLLGPEAVVRFVPEAEWSGESSLTFRAWDQSQGASGQGGVNLSGSPALSSASRTVIQRVAEIDDIPVSADGTVSVAADQAYTFSAGNFAYQDEENDPLTYVEIETLPTAGVLKLGGATITTPGYFIPAASLGSLVYDPSGAAGSSDSFSFTVHNDHDDSVTHTMTLNVTSSANTPPTPVNTTLTTSEDTPFSGFFLTDFGSDPDSGDLIESVQILGLTGGGSFTLNGNAVQANDVIAAASIPNLTFTPTANANGAGYATLQFELWDGSDWSAASATITMDVTALNDAPVLDIAPAVELHRIAEDGVGLNPGTPIGALLKQTDPKLYAISWNATSQQEEVHLLDPSGGKQLLGTLGDLASWSGQKVIDQASGKLYALGTTSGAVKKLYTFDLKTCQTTDLPFGGNNYLGGVDSNGKLIVITWNATTSTEEVYRLNPVTGGMELTGTVGDLQSWSGQNHYDTDSDTLYVLGNAPGNIKTLYRVDLTTQQVASQTVSTSYYLAGADHSGGLIVVSWNSTTSQEEIHRLDPGTGTFQLLASVDDFTTWSGQVSYDADSNMVYLFGNNGSNAPSYFKVDLLTQEVQTFSVSTGNYLGGIFYDPISLVSDEDGDSPGIAVTGLDTTNGTWHYTLDSTTWTAFGTVSESSATLLANDGTTRIRFTPNADYNGQASLTYKAWDGSVGNNGQTGVDASNPGNSDPFSTTTETAQITVVGINNAPLATSCILNINEDTPFPFTGTEFGYSDTDGDSMVSVMITGLPTGTLTLNGNPVIANDIIAVADIPNLVYTPPTNLNGSIADTIYFKTYDGTAWSAAADTLNINIAAVNDAPTDITLSVSAVAENSVAATVGTLFASDADVGDTATFDLLIDASNLFEISGSALKLKSGVSANYEAATSHNLTIRVTDSASFILDRVLTVTVTDANDAPVLTYDSNNPPMLPAVGWNATGGSGTNVAALVSGMVIDADGGSSGLAVINVENTYGSWEFSIDSGTTWNAIPAVSSSAALLLSDTDQVRFIPDSGFVGSAQFEFHAWDGSDSTPHGTQIALATGASAAFSSASGFAKVEVHPILNPAFMNQYNGIALLGGSTGDLAGQSVSLGDINGDGFADMVVGAPYAAYGANLNAGSTYVLLGGSKGNFSAPISLSSGLTGSNGFRLAHTAASSFGGYSASAVGDFNGDGLQDLITGAYGAEEGFILFGSSSAFTSDPLLLNNDSPSHQLLNGVTGLLGTSVDSAGDINGDGIDDMIIGAPGFNTDAGRAYVVFGSAAPTAAVDLSTLNGTTGLALTGFAASDYGGQVVSGLGDINGDGFDDFAVSAPSSNTAAGATYVVFGSKQPFDATLDLTTLDGTNGFKILGNDAGDTLGYVARGGDFNGDGIDDFLVGAPNDELTGNDNRGLAYVIFGATGGFGTAGQLNTTAITGSVGFVIVGAAAGDLAGTSVAGAGDMNGDGYDDLLIGASNANSGTGAAYLIFGTATPVTTTLSLANLNSPNGITFPGYASGDFAGISVAGGGDIDGDGFDDLFIGASGASNGSATSGVAFAVWGADMLGDVTLTGTSGSDILNGTTGDDVITGGLGNDTMDGGTGNDVLHGGAGNDIIVYDAADTLAVDGGGGFDTLQLSVGGFTLDLEQLGESTHHNLLTGFEAIDITGSGDNTLIVSTANVRHLPDAGATLRVIGNVGDTVQVREFTWTMTHADDLVDGGTTYYLYKSGNITLEVDADVQFTPALDLADLTSTTGTLGFTISGATAGDYMGVSVASAGDFNGDGWQDLIVGAANPNTEGTTTYDDGKAYILFGSAGGWSDVDLAASDNKFTLTGPALGGYKVGFSVASAGDFNGDGYDDVIIGAYAGGSPSNTGNAYIVFGSASYGSAPSALDLASLSTGGMVLEGPSSARGGFSVSGGGDVNGDGFDDVIVGAPSLTTYSGAYVVLGKSAPGTSLTLSTMTSTDGFVFRGTTTSDQAGFAVSMLGDINGDGLDDMIVGAPYADPVSNGEGQAYVIYGKTSAFSTLTPGMSGTDGFVINGLSSNDLAGFAVADAGDVNGDGFDDFLIGAKYGDPSTNAAGESYLIFGKNGNFTGPLNLSSLGSDGVVLTGININGHAGTSLAGAGDVNGDGFDDFLIGARHVSQGIYLNTGETYLIFGQYTWGSSLNLSDLTGKNGMVLRGIDTGDRSGFDVSAAGDLNSDGFADLILGAPLGDPNSNINGGESHVLYGADFTRDVTHLGGASADTITTTTSDANIFGMGGNDALTGFTGGDLIHGGTGDDIIVGAAGDDFLHGDHGNDTLWGGDGKDLLTGGVGNDTFKYASPSEGSTTGTSLLDVIKDFSATDLIQLTRSAFGSLPDTGDGFTLNAANYVEISVSDTSMATALSGSGIDTAATTAGMASGNPYAGFLTFTDTTDGSESGVYLFYDSDTTSNGVTLLAQVENVTQDDLNTSISNSHIQLT